MSGFFTLVLMAVGFPLLLIILGVMYVIAELTIFRIPPVRRWLYEEEPVHSTRTR